MTKVVVYLYRVYDAREDDYAISTRMATRTKIKQIRGEIIPGTKTEIDDKHFGGRLDGEGFCRAPCREPNASDSQWR